MNKIAITKSEIIQKNIVKNISSEKSEKMLSDYC